jgi:hypothetical protein
MSTPTPTPTTVDEEYDIIIAGGVPSPLSPRSSLSDREHDTCGIRRHGRLRRRKPSRDRGPRPAHPRVGSGALDAGQSSAHPACIFHLAPRAGLAHRARTCGPPKRSARRPLGDRPDRAVSRRRRQRQLCVPLSLFVLFVSRMRRLTREVCVDGWIVVRFWIRIRSNSHDVHACERLGLRCVEDGPREPRVGLGRPRSAPEKG